STSININLFYQRYLEFISWEYELMRLQPTSLREKIVHFFTNHFVVEVEKVKLPQLIYKQNTLFRNYAFGNFKELTKMVTTDPAMLIYLDGVDNTKNIPNENYARELLELFTIGIGNYSEYDIREAARALTGWAVDGLYSKFNEELFDSKTKEFMGKVGNFTYSDIIDIIFEKEETSRFICRKLYKEFIYHIPDENFIDELALIFRNNNYELKPVFSAMLKSNYFYSDQFKATSIKTPNDLIVGVMKQFNISGLSPLDYYFIIESSDKMKQLHFDPPDVRGWEGQRKWISTTTLPMRNEFTDSIISGNNSKGNPIGFSMNVLEFARSFESSEDAVQFVEDVINYLFIYPLSQNTKGRMLEKLLDGAVIQDWSTYSNQAETRIINFLKALARLPEYQLS
ncbi:MAG: DUF1800 domain-containing protein, partial [Ignavibacteriae bacterium]|nr:DUF1800 domain-containing protein [Ignavibacteriota bacterium]